MRKPFLNLAMGIACLLAVHASNAQSVFTTDLEILPESDVTTFELNPGDSLDIGLRVTNHGPDDIDTTSYIFWGFNDFPGFLVVQGDEGQMLPIATGDTVTSKGVRFVYNEEDTFDDDTSFDICYFLKTNLDPGEFITDTNPGNDTFCFTITYKKKEDPSALEQVKQDKTTVAIYPNPAEDIIHIPVDSRHNDMQVITVIAADGRICCKKELDATGKHDVTLATGQWPRGLYFVKVQSGKDISTGKFLLK